MFDALDRAVGREIAAPFAAGLALFCLLAAFGQLMKVADAVTGLGVAGDDVLLALAYSLPPLLGLLVPVATLFGCLLAFGRMASDRELLGMAALGLSPSRLLRVPMGLGLALGVVTLLATTVGEPWGIRGLRRVMARSAQRALAAGVRPGVFHAWVDGVMLYAGGRDGEALTDILLADHREPGRPLVVSARRGTVHAAATPADVVLALEGGTMLLAPETPAAAESYVLRFARGAYRLDVGGLVTNKARNLAEVQELSVRQLAALARDPDAAPAQRALAGVTLWRKPAMALAVPLFAMLAVPLGARGRGSARAWGLFTCAVLVALYYYVGRAAELSARSGQMSAFAAAWLPDALAALGLAALWPSLRRGR